MDAFMMSWFFIPLFFEIVNFFKSHNLVYILINNHISFVEENTIHSRHLKKHFPKAYLISILWMIFFFFKINIFIFEIRNFLFGFSTPLFIAQILFNLCKDRKNKIQISWIFLSPLKFFIPLYFNLCPANFLHLEPRLLISASCILLVITQLVLILLQYNFSTKQIFPCSTNIAHSYEYFKNELFFTSNSIKIKEATCSICLNELDKNINDIESNEILDHLNDYSKVGNNNTDTIINVNEVIVLRESFCRKLKKIAFKTLSIFKKIVLFPFKLMKYINIKLCVLFKLYLCKCYFKNSPKDKNNSIMVTPCNHIFHTSCLVSWMDHKEVCPICRSQLPDYD